MLFWEASILKQYYLVWFCATDARFCTWLVECFMEFTNFLIDPISLRRCANGMCMGSRRKMAN